LQKNNRTGMSESKLNAISSIYRRCIIFVFILACCVLAWQKMKIIRTALLSVCRFLDESCMKLYTIASALIFKTNRCKIPLYDHTGRTGIRLTAGTEVAFMDDDMVMCAPPHPDSSPHASIAGNTNSLSNLYRGFNRPLRMRFILFPIKPFIKYGKEGGK
jgi:hypothetical protein